MPELRLQLREISGAFGDLGTFLPLTLAMAQVSGISFTAALFFAGLWNIWTGWYYRIPMAVQPMKAIAALAIADSLNAAQVGLAGMLAGGILIVLALSGGLTHLLRWVPLPVVRGLQLGLGLMMALKAADWVLPQMLAFNMLGVVALAAIAVMILLPRWPVALCLVLIGAGWVMMHPGAETLAVSLAEPGFYMLSITRDDWLPALSAASSQLPLTLLNSVAAVVVLARDLFPAQAPTQKSVALNVGVMNIIGPLFGGIPVCHGSGGLAAQYRFGARSGISVMILGALKILCALLGGAALATAAVQFPAALLGVLLLFAGLELAKHGLQAQHWQEWLVLLLTAVVMMAAGTLYAVAVGLLITVLWQAVFPRRKDSA